MRTLCFIALLLLAGCGDPRPTSGQRPRWGIPEDPEAAAPDPGEGNVLVSVERLEYDASRAAEVELLWRYAGRGVEIESGGWGRVAGAGDGFSAKVRALERTGVIRGRENLFVAVRDGSEGEILLGETEWKRQRSGASLLVRPRRQGEAVVLDLLPRFSRMDGRGAVTVEEARTRILARPGVPLVLGGMDTSADSLDRGLFSRDSREGTRRVLLVLTVRAGP